MNSRSVHGITLTAVVAAFSACGGGGGSVTMPAPPPTPTPTATPTIGPTPCPLSNLVPAPPDLLYPVPNATGVPNGNFTLVVGYGSSAPPVPQLVPANGGSAVNGGAWGRAPTPLPSPAATPRSPGETLYGSAIPALAAHTTYSVQVTFGTPPCQTTESAGSFTTQ